MLKLKFTSHNMAVKKKHMLVCTKRAYMHLSLFLSLCVIHALRRTQLVLKQAKTLIK